jgi:hypothetical protein
MTDETTTPRQMEQVRTDLRDATAKAVADALSAGARPKTVVNELLRSAELVADTDTIAEMATAAAENDN